MCWKEQTARKVWQIIWHLNAFFDTNNNQRKARTRTPVNSVGWITTLSVHRGTASSLKSTFVHSSTDTLLSVSRLMLTDDVDRFICLLQQHIANYCCIAQFEFDQPSTTTTILRRLPLVSAKNNLIRLRLSSASIYFGVRQKLSAVVFNFEVPDSIYSWQI